MTENATTLSPDEAIRLAALERLSLQLDGALGFLAVCQGQTAVPEKDPLRAVGAAASILRGSAVVAGALARLAQVETRHRTIVQFPEGFDSKGRPLNSHFSSKERDEEIRKTLFRRLLPEYYDARGNYIGPADDQDDPPQEAAAAVDARPADEAAR